MRDYSLLKGFTERKQYAKKNKTANTEFLKIPKGGEVTVRFVGDFVLAAVHTFRGPKGWGTVFCSDWDPETQTYSNRGACPICKNEVTGFKRSVNAYQYVIDRSDNKIKILKLTYSALEILMKKLVSSGKDSPNDPELGEDIDIMLTERGYIPIFTNIVTPVDKEIIKEVEGLRPLDTLFTYSGDSKFITYLKYKGLDPEILGENFIVEDTSAPEHSVKKLVNETNINVNEPDEDTPKDDVSDDDEDEDYDENDANEKPKPKHKKKATKDDDDDEEDYDFEI